MATGIESEQESSPRDFCSGQEIVWYQAGRWGRKHAFDGVFVEYRGKASAQIEAGGCVRTVRLDSISPR